MVQQTQKRHNCKTCRYYCAYYMEGICTYDKTEIGRCSQRKAEVNENEGCILYRKQTKTGINISLEHIDSVLTDLQVLARIFYRFECRMLL